MIENIEEHLERAGLRGPFLLVSQPRILRLLAPLVRKRFPILAIPEGERAKNLATVTTILRRMTELEMTRQSTLIALGGGVVGDVAGFAASLYMRGVAVVQAPTTLLAQVDSSIGGKTGVNFAGVKNLVGTFHQPSLVVSDIDALKTLPAREYASGLYEALKYAVLCDPDMFANFVSEIRLLLEREPAAVERLVGRCASIKAGVVSADEKEGDLRRVLNLGHTVGHGLESAAGFRRLKHGEAVGWGMIAAARISRELGRIPDTDVRQIESAVRSIGTLPPLDGLKLRPVLHALKHDKKVRDGHVHFVLPHRIGRVEITKDVPLELVRATVKNLLHESKARS